MKRISLYQFVLRRQLQQLLLAVLSIFILSAAFFIFSAQYRALRQANETARFIGGYLDNYFDPYIQQSRYYDQNQNIRNLLSNLHNSPEISSITWESKTSELDLSSDTVLCIGSQVIWPADAVLPDSMQPQSLTSPALYYDENLYFVTPYFNFFHTEQLGSICYLISYTDFSSYIERYVPNDLSFSISDAVGTVFFSSGNIPELSTDNVASLQEDGFCCTVYPNLNVEMKNAKVMLICLLVVCVFVLFFSLLHSRHIAIKLTDPIVALTKQLQHNQSGDLEMQYDIPSNIAEINQLTNTYADLIRQLKDLITQNQKQNLLRMEAELSLLQTQINPHFLFNTLEVISSQAIMESADVTAEMIQRLGTMFRYNLRAPDIVPLVQELKTVGDYFFLQNMQWDEKVRLDTNIDNSIYEDEIMVPKLTLQPILENCFQHGFDPGTGTDFYIRLSAQKQGDFLRISVKDNGCGLQKEQIKALYDDFLKDRNNFRHFIDRTSHIGLRNVNARLCIHFHVDQAVWIESEPRNGTTVIICVPIQNR